MIAQEQIKQRVIARVRETTDLGLHVLDQNKQERLSTFLHNTVDFQVHAIDWNARDDVDRAINRLASEFLAILRIVLKGIAV